MSVHGKPRVAPHKHFSSEVEQVRQVQSNRPAYRGVHWTDTVIDGTRTLDETIVDFTRQWEEDMFTNVDAKCSIIVDAKAKNGYAMQIPSNQGNIAEPFDAGDFTECLGAEYYCIFRLKVASNASNSNLATLRLVASGAERASRIIKPSDFVTSGEYQIFAIKGRTNADDTNVYCDIYGFIGGITALTCDWIGIVPANVPLGTQDTETDAHTGTDTNAHAGTNTNSHSGTTSANTNLAYTNLLSLALGTEQLVDAGPTFDLIRTGTTSTPSGSPSRFRVYIYWQRGTSGGWGRVQFALYLNDVSYTWEEMV